MLIASGLFHVGVYLFADGGLGGPVSWRKPIEFGLSGGITALSLALLMARLPPVGALAWPCAVAISLFLPEVALIDLQRWRGVPSHFNDATLFDSAVFGAMGILISLVSLAIVALTVWSFVSLRGPTSTALAIRVGMVFLTLGQLLGFAIVTNGTSPGHDPLNASILGAAGEMKVPHAVALHGLQVLGLLALVLERSALAEAQLLALVLVAIAGYTLAFGVAIGQTFGGRAPADLTPLTLAGSLVAVALLAVAFGAALRAARFAAAAGEALAN